MDVVMAVSLQHPSHSNIPLPSLPFPSHPPPTVVSLADAVALTLPNKTPEFNRKPAALSNKFRGEENENVFRKRAMNQLTNRVMTGTPTTQTAAVNILGQVGKPGTTTTIIVNIKTANKTPAVGKLAAVVDGLLMVQGIQS